MVSGLIVFIHVIVSILLIVIVLLQSSKGGGLSGFLSGAAESTLGVRGATTFLHKMTVALAIIFMITSLSLAYINAKRNAVVEGEETVIEETAQPGDIPAESQEGEQKAGIPTEEMDETSSGEAASEDNSEGISGEEESSDLNESENISGDIPAETDIPEPAEEGPDIREQTEEHSSNS